MDATYEPATGLRETVRRFVYFTAPPWFVYSYLGVLSLAYVIVIVHTPITIVPGMPHDDGLFMRLGRSLAEGHWLGPYNQFTLMKGPGYPAFLAVANWLGISVSFAHALSYCAAVLFFVRAAHRFIKSQLLSGLLFTMLLWQLLPTIPEMDRILREQISGTLTIALFAAAIATFFLARSRGSRIQFAALTGFLLSWFWLTRAEGAWILPGAILLVGAAAFRDFRLYRLRRLGEALITIVCVFVLIQIGFCTVNLVAYGKFVGVDFNEANYQRALRAIDSVRSGGIKPFISVTQPARQAIYNVSPSFASLRSYFEGPAAAGWEKFTCDAYPASCGKEIAAGWFVWALRDAASAAGHYASADEASAFFGAIADEIVAACDRRALTCKSQLIAEMPPVNWSDAFLRTPALYAQAFRDLVMLPQSLAFFPSGGDEAQLATALAFLNYPLEVPPIDSPSIIYSLTGWYYKSGSKWFRPTVRLPSGFAADIQFDRLASPDIQSAFNDPEASHQRFSIKTRCKNGCELKFESQDGEIVEKKLGEFRRGSFSFDLGKGKVQIDNAIIGDYATSPRLMDVIARRFRLAVMRNYALLEVPVLLLGIFCFIAAALIYRRLSLMNISFIIAFCAWTLVLTRSSLVVLIAATSFNAMQFTYLWPAQVLLIIGAVFSFAAFLQLWLSGEKSVPRSRG